MNNERITSACVHLHKYTNQLNIVWNNPNFSEIDIQPMKMYIECIETALTDLKEEFEKIKELEKRKVK